MRDGINTGKDENTHAKETKACILGDIKKLQKNWPQPAVLQKFAGSKKITPWNRRPAGSCGCERGGARARRLRRRHWGAAPRGLPKGTYRAGAMRLLRTAAGTQGEDLGWRRLRRAPRVILTDRHHIHSAMASPQTCHCCNTLADR